MTADLRGYMRRAGDDVAASQAEDGLDLRMRDKLPENMTAGVVAAG
jgi:hypothetical protein